MAFPKFIFKYLKYKRITCIFIFYSLQIKKQIRIFQLILNNKINFECEKLDL